MLKYANAKFHLYMQNLFAYARPAKKLVAGPPRNLSQARRETCHRPAEKLVTKKFNKLKQKRKNDMKKYRLRQWYPSLPINIEVGHVIEIDSRSFSNGDNTEYYLVTDNPKMWVTSRELHPDFWELIEKEKPLFTTDDGVEVFIGHSFIIVGDDFIKHKLTACNLPYTQDFKKFKHESNADEYILWNKPLLSLQEIDATIKGHLPEFDELKKLAEKRIKS